jgi:hypothetical protein
VRIPEAVIDGVTDARTLPPSVVGKPRCGLRGRHHPVLRGEVLTDVEEPAARLRMDVSLAVVAKPG